MGAHEHNDIGRRLGNPQIVCRRDNSTVIGYEPNGRKLACVPGHNFSSSIGTETINDQDLQPVFGEIIGENGIQAIADVVFLVPARNDDRHRGVGGH